MQRGGEGEAKPVQIKYFIPASHTQGDKIKWYSENTVVTIKNATIEEYIIEGKCDFVATFVVNNTPIYMY